MQREELDDLVIAQIYSFRAEAELARSALEANGIEAMIEADDCGGQRPLLGANLGVRLGGAQMRARPRASLSESTCHWNFHSKSCLTSTASVG